MNILHSLPLNINIYTSMILGEKQEFKSLCDISIDFCTYHHNIFHIHHW